MDSYEVHEPLQNPAGRSEKNGVPGHLRLAKLRWSQDSAIAIGHCTRPELPGSQCGSARAKGGSLEGPWMLDGCASPPTQGMTWGDSSYLQLGG